MLGVSQYFNNKSELELPTNNCSTLALTRIFALASLCLSVFLCFQIYCDLYDYSCSIFSPDRSILDCNKNNARLGNINKHKQQCQWCYLAIVQKCCTINEFLTHLLVALADLLINPYWRREVDIYISRWSQVPMTVTNRVKHYAGALIFHLPNIYISLLTRTG